MLDSTSEREAHCRCADERISSPIDIIHLELYKKQLYSFYRLQSRVENNSVHHISYILDSICLMEYDNFLLLCDPPIHCPCFVVCLTRAGITPSSIHSFLSILLTLPTTPI